MTSPGGTGPRAGVRAPALRIVATGSHRLRSTGRHGRRTHAMEPAGVTRTVAITGPAADTGDGGSPAGPASLELPRIAIPYIVTALISVVVVGLASVWVSRGIAHDDAVDGAIFSTQYAADVAVAPLITDAVLAGDPAALARLDDAVRNDVLNVSMRRVKIWDATGRIAYSDEPRLIGNRYPLGEDELDALNGMTASAEISDLTAPENRYEEPDLQLLEVYLPLHTPSGTPILFEAYSRYAGVTEAAQRIWLRFIPLGVGALVLLELLQLPIAAVLSRRLRRARAQRELTLRRSLSAVDDERRRIAGDLHDGVVQDLAGVAFQLGAVSRMGSRGPIDPAQVAESADRVRRSVRSLRSLLVEIYPPNLYDEGLAAALSDLAARLAPTDVTVVIDVAEPLPPLPMETVELVYRVAQEGLRNVVRHAAASTATVELGPESGQLVLCIADDGAGCDPDRFAAQPGHLGLRALGALAAQHGAVLLIESGPGRGTVLRLEVPLRLEVSLGLEVPVIRGRR